MRRLRIVTLWYPPEQAAFGVMMKELASFMAERGWDVEVDTSLPSHPRGVVFEGWQGRRGRSEEDGIPVRRLRSLVSPRRGALARGMGQFSFSVSAAWAVLIGRRSDVVLAPLQPLFLGPLLGLVCRVRRTSLVWLVQDLHPDALVDLGLLRDGIFVRMLRWCERIGYRSGSSTISICPAFAQHVVARGGKIAEGSSSVIRNWCRPSVLTETPGQSTCRSRLGLPADGIVLVYAGTLSYSSGASLLIEVARRLEESVPKVIVFVVGEGPLRPQFDRVVDERSSSNLIVRDFVSAEMLPDVLGAADIAAVTMDPASARNSLPSKAISYLGAGIPVVADCPVGSPLHDELSEAGAARFATPADPASFADAVADLASTEEDRRILGDAGRRFVQSELKAEVALPKYAEILERILR